MPIRPKRKKGLQMCSVCEQLKNTVDYYQGKPVCYECLCPDNGPKTVDEWLEGQIQETMLSKGRIYSDKIIGNRTKKVKEENR